MNHGGYINRLGEVIARPFAATLTRMDLEGKAERLRRNWTATGLAAAVAVVGAVLAIHDSAFGAPLGVLGVIFGTLLFTRNAFPLATPASYRVTETALTLDQETIAGADILEVRALPLRTHAIIELTLRDHRVVRLRLPVDQLRDFTSILQARRAAFRLMTSLGHRFLGFLAAFTALSFLGGVEHFPRGIVASLVTLVSAAMSVTIPALLFAWLAGFIRGRVVVGTDGFVTRWLFRERFVPFSKVAAVQPETRVTQRDVIDTVVELSSGRRLRLRPLEVPNTEVERGSEGRALYTHLAAAFERSKQASSAMPDVRALVERGSRSTKEWLTGIDGLVGGGGARYRVAQLSHDSLLAVATDPNASVDARVGAAAALIRTNDDALRVRVRVCAESCTDRSLREAMLALAEARDDEATETALAVLRP